jgi:hypothetical protein
MLRHARHARPARARRARDRAVALAGPASRWLIRPVRRRKKTLVLTGTALALATASSAAAATPGGLAAEADQHAHVTADLRPAAAHQARQRPVTSLSARKPVHPHTVPVTWQQVQNAINWQTNPGAAREGRLPAADQLMPAGTTGPQDWMPISGSQLANATTIVQQTLAKRMGIRSAVIAVATAMQESRLQDLGYGDGDSLGLFQQRPSCGWGTAQQIMNPAFAADAFLAALQQYQAANPDWAAQPLWESAQGVQKSGFALAYAQWEAQAASMVQQIAISQQQAAQAAQPAA